MAILKWNSWHVCGVHLPTGIRKKTTKLGIYQKSDHRTLISMESKVITIIVYTRFLPRPYIFHFLRSDDNKHSIDLILLFEGANGLH